MGVRLRRMAGVWGCTPSAYGGPQDWGIKGVEKILINDLKHEIDKGRPCA